MISQKSQIATKAALVLTILFLFACEIFYFRNILFSDRLIGNTSDGLLTNLLAEHWFRFFSGKEAFRDLIIFFPAENTLSYSDTLFVFGVIHSLFRLFGVNMFISYKLTLILIHVFGVFSMLYLLRVKLKISFPACIFGIIIFAYSYSAVNGHSQLYAYFFLPSLLILIYGFFANIHSTRFKRLIYGCAAIVFFVAIFFNSSYIGYFFFLLISAFGVVFLIICTYKRTEPFKQIFSYVRTNLVEVGVFLCVGVISACPVLYVYLPAMREFGGRSWNEVCLYLPTLFDYVNFSGDNLIYGNFSRAFPPPNRNSELRVGFPFLTIIIFCLALIYTWRKMPAKLNKFTHVHKKKKQKEIAIVSVPQYEYMIFASLGIAVLLLLFIILKFGGTYSLWYIFYKLIPGAASMRVISRMCQVLMLPIALITAYFLNAVIVQIPHKGLKTVTICVTITFILLEYTWSSGVYSAARMSDIQSDLSAIPPPPTQCEVIYLTDVQIPSQSPPFHIRSWMIANHFGLKTIAGYSGQYPTGWPLWCAPEDYEENAHNWIAAHKLKNVYSYNLGTMQWQAIN